MKMYTQWATPWATRPNLIDDLHQASAVSQVAIVQDHVSFFVGGFVGVEVLDALRVWLTGSPHDPVYLVILVDQKFSQIRAILPRDACKKNSFY